MKNGEYIRNMTDEELADFILGLDAQDMCEMIPFCKDLPECEDALNKAPEEFDRGRCRQCLIRYLGEEKSG